MPGRWHSRRALTWLRVAYRFRRAVSLRIDDYWRHILFGSLREVGAMIYNTARWLGRFTLRIGTLHRSETIDYTARALTGYGPLHYTGTLSLHGTLCITGTPSIHGTLSATGTLSPNRDDLYFRHASISRDTGRIGGTLTVPGSLCGYGAVEHGSLLASAR
jgi:hypothetical protein